jgi:hypothetical protein
MLKNSGLQRKEDAAVFCALIEKIDGRITATCCTSFDHPYVMSEKRPATSTFSTRREAEAWAAQKAKACGFANIRWLAQIDLAPRD